MVAVLPLHETARVAEDSFLTTNQRAFKAITVDFSMEEPRQTAEKAISSKYLLGFTAKLAIWNSRGDGSKALKRGI